MTSATDLTTSMLGKRRSHSGSPSSNQQATSSKTPKLSLVHQESCLTEPYGSTCASMNLPPASLSHPLTLDSNQEPYSSFPPFQKPVPIASFSFDEERRLWHDDRSKRYYRGPPPYNLPRHTNHGSRGGETVGADLNYGFQRYRQRDESVPEHLDALLECLQHGADSAEPSLCDQIDSDRQRAHLITWRGIVTKICTAFDQFHPPSPSSATPDSNSYGQDSLELNAMMVGNTLYLEEYVSSEKRTDKQNQGTNDRLKKLGYHGYSFESYCTVDHPEQILQPLPLSNPYSTLSSSSSSSSSSPPLPPPLGWSGDVNTNVQWCQVVKTKLGDSRLILGGEVDAVDQYDRMVELKTSMQIRPSTNDQFRFESKLLKFYTQSFLLGIPRIVVGFRDPRGHLITHQEFETLSIPRLVRAGMPIPGSTSDQIRQSSVWEPKNSLGFGNDILCFLRRTIRKQTLFHFNHTLSSSDCQDQDQPIPFLATEIAIQSYPIFRVQFLPPFDHVSIHLIQDKHVLSQVKDNGSSGLRVGFLPKSYYQWLESRSPSTVLTSLPPLPPPLPPSQ